jgi:hypothetical protein
MKATTFPWLLMQNNTFQPIKIKDFFYYYLNAHKAKRKNIDKSKPRKTFGLSTDRKDSL